MIEDGFYSLSFFHAGQEPMDSAQTVALFRDGRLLGSDPLGGVFSGRYSPCHWDHEIGLEGRFVVPRHSVLVTGQRTGDSPVTLAFSGWLDARCRQRRGTIEIGGRWLSVQLTFMHGVPH